MFRPLQGCDAFDAHAHVMRHCCPWNYYPYGIEEHVRTLESASFSGGAVFAGRHEHGYLEANQEILKGVSGTNLVPFARVGLFGSGPGEIEAALDAGAKGWKIHTRNVRPDAEKLQPLFRSLAETDLPIVFHSDVFHNSAPSVLAKPIDAHDFSLVIIAHAGKNLWVEAAGVAKDRDNVVVDTSIATYLQTRGALSVLGPDKVLFGSDEPFGDVQVERFKVEKAVQCLWPDDASARAKVLGGAARKLLGLPARDE